jgi:predicted GH43/DUF377 family glycosyl hydrolase
MTTRYESLLRRHPQNPILTASQWPYPAHSVFNPGATLLEDGTTLLLCRVEDRRGFSHLCAARSANGIDDWSIDYEPTLSGDPANFPEELWGIEDARITYIPEEGKYFVAFTAFGRNGPGVSVASTEDFRSFTRYGLAMQPDDKDAAFLPKRVEGSYALIHRPVTDASANIWISYSPDLQNWGRHTLMLPARKGGWWDANKIGLSCPPIETERGWLMIYHGVRTHASGSIYRLSLALFDLEDPSRCLSRAQSWMFAPEEPYERVGDVDNAIFPCGFTIGKDHDTLHLYYGAADTSICLATGSIGQMLDWLDRDGSSFVGVAGQAAERG